MKDSFQEVARKYRTVQGTQDQNLDLTQWTVESHGSIEEVLCMMEQLQKKVYIPCLLPHVMGHCSGSIPH